MYKDLFKGIGGAFIVLLAIIVAVVGVWALTVAWAPWKGAGEARKQIQGDGNFRIVAYTKFYDDCASAQTLQDNIEVTKNKIKQAKKSGDSAELSRQQTNLQAQTNQLNDLVNHYNADSHKSWTIAQFKANDLPFTISTDQEIQCGS
jgi:hypothetical protein